MKKNIIHTALFRIFVPIPYGTLIYLLLLMINNNLLIIDEAFLSVELLFCIALTYLTLEVNRLVIVSVFKKNSLAVLNNLIQVAVNATVTLVVTYFSLMLYFVVFLGYASLTGFDTELKSFAIFFGITSLLYNMLALSYNLLNIRNEQLFDDEETLKEHIQFELENYQAEVNPELLFESLESAITLIHQDVDQAEDYIDRLALVYRYMLSNRNNDNALINSEVEAAKNLIALHNVRHNNLISLTSKISSAEINILPSSLPLLVEEIIKSNIISAGRPLEIVLTLEDDYLTLSHKLNERLVKNTHEILTFKRLQTAYAFFTDQPVIKVQAYGDAFYKIPILTRTAA
jgi:Histidine kinase